MVPSSEIFLENILVESIKAKNADRFNEIVRAYKVNLDETRTWLDNFSVFEKILQTPKSGELVKICLRNGSNFFENNNNGVYPICYAVASLCVENLQALMTSTNQIDSDHDDILISIIMNEKLDAGNNYLHHLVERMTIDNFSDVSEMIKLLVANKCSLNSLNNQGDSAITALHKKLQEFPFRTDFIELLNHNSTMKINAFKHDDLELVNNIPHHDKTIKNVNYMNHLLEQWQEEKFIEELEEFRLTDEFERSLSVLLETAVARDMRKIVTSLLTNGADVRGIPDNSKFDSPVAFTACYFGHHKVLEELMIHPSFHFKSAKKNRNLLHEVCDYRKVNLKGRKKCFDILIADERCTREIVNEEDEQGFVPLYYAVKNELNEIAFELVRRGASLSHNSILYHTSREAQTKLCREYMEKLTYFNSNSEEDSLMYDDLDKIATKKEKFERIAWYIFIAVIACFLIFSIFGIYQNIKKGCERDDEFIIHQSGFRLKTHAILTLTGGGKMNSTNKLGT